MDNGPVVFIAGDALGEGDPALGRTLIQSALARLADLAPPPAAVLFMNAGVKLCCEGAKTLPELQILADAGVEILCCGTCLDFYGLEDALRVGRASNMAEILARQASAPVVIRL